MSVITGVAKAASTKVLTGTRPTTRVFPKTKLMLFVVLTLVAFVAFAALIPTSEISNTELYSVGSKDYQSGTAAPVSQPAGPQMSERQAIDAYGKLPLSFISNEGQTDKAVRYYAQGAGYGFSSPKRGLRSPSPKTKSVVATHWPSTS